MVQNITNYTFNASAKEVTLTGVTANVEKVRLIKNLTTNTYIYKFTDALTISAAGSVLTFTGSNAGMSDTDDLLIQYDLETSLDKQKMFLSDPDGNNIAVLTPAGTTDKMIEVAQSATDFYAGTGNTTTTNLSSGATFTGTIENVYNQQAYSILFKSDQNCTITIYQYTDASGVYLNQSTVFTYVANSNFARSGVMNGNYFKVSVTNNGGSTTTVLNLNTAYGTLPSATALNNAPMSLDEVNGTTFTLGQKSSALSLPIVPASDDFLTGQSAQTATIQNILTATSGTAASDVSAYRSFNCQVVSTGTAGTFIFEGSNDNVNFQAVPVYNQALVVRVPIVTAITASVSQIIYEGSCNFKYLRLRIATTITGGSIQAFTNLIQTPLGTASQIVSNGTAANLLTTAAQSGTWTMQVGNTPNTTAILANHLIPVAANTGDTGAKVASGNGATLTNTAAKGISATINIGTVTGTTPTAVFKIQYSNDAGTTWLDLPNATTATITTTGVFGITVYPAITTAAGTATTGSVALVNSVMPRTFRFVWTIGGTTPSFTITNIQLTYLL
jgi:hypothetical protein